jgi:aspartate 1-decarboxylase
MFITVFKSKLHRATVTEANLNYVGSVTIDSDLMDAAGILAGEQVHIVNNNNGARLVTYTIEGDPGSGVICLNGAAARLVQPGDQVIIISYAMMDALEALTFKPTIIQLDGNNRILGRKHIEAHGDTD